MLSILIPVYNFKVEKLVKALMRQCDKQGIMYEILCFDDGSSKSTRYANSILSDFFGVNYSEMSENLGRARIRNWMAKSASFDTLLFLDCDSKVVKKDFIATYLGLAKEADVVNGGRVYSRKPPRAKSKRLHWRYGKSRESRKARNRQKEPALFFHSNNFLAARKVVLAYPFDESHTGYGYEDLLWARQLLDEGITISHVDNPVEHLGLEKSDRFIKKARQATRNLVRLRLDHPGLETQLTRFAERLEKLKLKTFMLSFLQKKAGKYSKDLQEGKAPLWKLSLLKLYWYWLETNN